jgi:LysR family transcriptional regulator, cyn operon transcriptional activator
MNLQQLRYLVSAADTGSISRAAQTCRVTQPVVSRALHDLEREFGVVLFRKTGRRLAPTDAGLTVAAAARRALDAVDEVEGTARRLAPGSELSVVTTPTNSALLSPIVTVFVQHFPQTALRLRRAGSMGEVLDLVATGQADLGFGDLTDQPPSRSMRIQTLWQAEAVVVSPIGTELPPVVRPKDLTAVKLILPPEGSERRRMIEHVFSSADAKTPSPALATDERSAWIASAKRGVGSFLTYRMVAVDLDGIEVRSFDPPIWPVVGFAFRADSISHHGQEMLRLATDLPVPRGCQPLKK